MSWYVSRNGETVGPVHASQVLAWAKEGQWDLHVRDGDHGHFVPIMRSQFSSAVDTSARKHKDYVSGTALAIFVPAFGLVMGLISILQESPISKRFGWHLVAVSAVSGIAAWTTYAML